MKKFDAQCTKPFLTVAQTLEQGNIRYVDPSLVCDFFAVTAVVGAGTGESLNRLPVVPHELILADAGYCSIAGIEHVRQ